MREGYGLDRRVEFLSNPKQVTLLLENAVRIIKHKAGLLNLAEELGNVSPEPARPWVYPATAAIAIKRRSSKAGLKRSLISCRQPNLKTRVDDLTEQSVLTPAIAYPAHGHTGQ
jgi:hypothetical protein